LVSVNSPKHASSAAHFKSVPNVSVVETVAARLAAYTDAWIRAAAINSTAEGAWQLYTAEIVAGGAPPHWEPIEWVYPAARFEAARLTGRQAAQALFDGRFTVARATCEIVSFPESVEQERRESWAQYSASEPLDWPSNEWRIGVVGAQLNTPQAELVADGLAPFKSFDLPLANLFGLTYRPNWSPPRREAVVRELDRQGRIDTVFVDPAYVDASVSGEALAGSTLSLAADTPGQAQILDGSSPQMVRFETPEGTPGGAWVALVRDGELLDRRYIDRSRLQATQPGVSYAEPPPEYDSGRPYSPEEQASIRQAIDRVKIILPARFPEFSGEQLVELEQSLDAAVAELPNLKRSLWDRLMLGTIAGAVGKEVITREAGTALIKLLEVALRSLPALHGLPPV
jgi:hypothetical protein